MLLSAKEVIRVRKIFFLALACLLFALARPVFAETPPTPVKVGYFENEIFQEGAEKGAIRRGYAYEYYRKLSEYTGWEYEYVYGSFADLYQMLLDGKIDLLAGLAKTEERQGVIGYPEAPMGSETYNMVKHRADDSITTTFSTLSGKKIGVLDSAMVGALQRFLAQQAIYAEVVTYPTHQEMLDDFDENKIDALVAESDGTYDRPNAALLYPFGSTDYYLCVNSRRPDLWRRSMRRRISSRWRNRTISILCGSSIMRPASRAARCPTRKKDGSRSTASFVWAI